MQIVSLVAENVKRLTAVSIRPDGALVQITGRNGAGKTSVLDSIWLALDYGEAHKDMPEPIRKGADSARIKLDLGEVIVTRTFARGKENDNQPYTTAIRVTNAEGAAYPSPQKMIDDLVGALSFDPLEFNALKPAEQFDVLGRVFAPDINFKDIALLQKADFDRRATLSKAAKEARGAAEQIPLPDGLPEEAPDVSALTLRLSGAADHNSEIDRRAAKRTEVSREADRLRDRGNELAEEAQTLRARADALERDSQELLTKSEAERKRVLSAPRLPEKIDTQELTAQIELARNVEKLIDQRTLKNRHTANAEKLETDAKNLTAIMQAREDGKQRAIAAVQLPVPGLSFGDGVVLLDGVPFEQGSDAQRINTSVAIAMAMNPKLRVLRIRQGSLLDADSLKLVAELAAKNDYQVWCEMVDSSGSVGFVIEDGRLKGAAPAAESTAAAAPKSNGSAALAKPRTKPAAAPAVPETAESDL